MITLCFSICYACMYLQHLKFLILSKINAHESLQLPALCGLVLHLFIELLPSLLRMLKPNEWAVGNQELWAGRLLLEIGTMPYGYLMEVCPPFRAALH